MIASHTRQRRRVDLRWLAAGSRFSQNLLRRQRQRASRKGYAVEKIASCNLKAMLFVHRGSTSARDLYSRRLLEIAPKSERQNEDQQ